MKIAAKLALWAVLFCILGLGVIVLAGPPQPTQTESTTARWAFRDGCRAALKAQLANPATWNETAAHEQPDARSGSVWFDAGNRLGMVGHYHGVCWTLADGRITGTALAD